MITLAEQMKTLYRDSNYHCDYTEMQYDALRHIIPY